MARALHHGLLSSSSATASAPAAAAAPSTAAAARATRFFDSSSQRQPRGASADTAGMPLPEHAAARSFRSRYDEGETRLASLLVDAPELRLSLRAVPQACAWRSYMRSTSHTHPLCFATPLQLPAMAFCYICSATCYLSAIPIQLSATSRAHLYLYNSDSLSLYNSASLSCATPRATPAPTYYPRTTHARARVRPPRTTHVRRHASRWERQGVRRARSRHSRLSPVARRAWRGCDM